VNGTFGARMDELRARTRSDRGVMTGSVEVDQVYAHAQHEHLEYKHPRGGMARYLAAGLEARYREYLQAVADGVLDDGGRDGMRRSMESLSGEVYDRAPREFMDLRRSGHPQVRQGLDVLYDRPPMQHRLSDAELRAKSRLRYAALPDRLKGWIWWHVQKHMFPPPRRH
jgi:hypothetical protein